MQRRSLFMVLLTFSVAMEYASAHAASPTIQAAPSKLAFGAAWASEATKLGFALTAPAQVGDMSRDKGIVAYPADSTATLTDKDMAKPKGGSFKGEVTEVDEDTKKFSVKSKNGIEKEFSWNSRTVVAPKGIKLKEGQVIQVTSKDGVVSQIEIIQSESGGGCPVGQHSCGDKKCCNDKKSG